MGRLIGGAVLGYVVVFVLIFLLFSGAYLVLGAEGSFRPGTYEVTTTWVFASFLLGFLAAGAGGWVAAAVGRDPRAAWILAGIIVVLGLVMAVPVLGGGPEAAELSRGADVGVMDAMQNARTPGWIALLNPLVGAIGAIAGGKLRGGARREVVPAA